MVNTTRWQFGIKNNLTIDTGPNKQVSENVRGLNGKILLIVCEYRTTYLTFCKDADLKPNYDALYFCCPDMIRGSYSDTFQLINLQPNRAVPLILAEAYYYVTEDSTLRNLRQTGRTTRMVEAVVKRAKKENMEMVIFCFYYDKDYVSEILHDVATEEGFRELQGMYWFGDFAFVRLRTDLYSINR